MVSRCHVMLGLVVLLSGLRGMNSADEREFLDVKIFNLDTSPTIANLTCYNGTSNQSNHIPPGFEPVEWMLPNLDRIAFDVDEKYYLLDGNQTLQVNVTGKEDLGVYHCMTRNMSDLQNSWWYLVKVGLNVEGPFLYDDSWEMYKYSVLYSLVGFFGFLICVGLLILVYVFRWDPEVSGKVGPDPPEMEEKEPEMFAAESNEQAEDTTNPEQTQVDMSFENPAFEKTENPES